MSNYSTIQTSNSEIKDPELRKLVDHFTSVFKTTGYQSVYGITQKKSITYNKINVGVKKQKQYDTVGYVLNEWMKAKKSDNLKFAAMNSGFRNFLSHTQLNSLRLIDIKSKKYTLEQFDTKREFSYINDSLFNRIGTKFGVDMNSTVGTSTVSPALTLKLNLQKVKCIDETDPEWGGKDEISVGGVVVDDKQVQSLISEFRAGNYNDGEQTIYNPVKELATFILDNTNPSTYMAFITLAEKDAGGFASFLQKLYDAIKAEMVAVLTALGAAAGAQIGAAIGGTIGSTVAGPIGTIIGIAAGLILGALIGWLISALQDDVFQPAVTGITLNTNAAFTGPVQTLSYRDFGGTYTINVFWSAS